MFRSFNWRLILNILILYRRITLFLTFIHFLYLFSFLIFRCLNSKWNIIVIIICLLVILVDELLLWSWFILLLLFSEWWVLWYLFIFQLWGCLILFNFLIIRFIINIDIFTVNVIIQFYIFLFALISIRMEISRLPIALCWLTADIC